ncbi:MAG: hypothetical protein AMJ70_01155 [Dehalococcoidia bacterium SG8_51_3]|nr:MAG: hypothetical protein AMJ70_01155 [Dehalococcoidia bacterium SG8_51_3]
MYYVVGTKEAYQMISRRDTRTSEYQVKTRLSTCLLILCIGVVVAYGQEELPDNYLPISLEIQDTRLEGGCGYLEGFTFSMDLPPGFLKKTFDKEKLFEIVRSEKITGTLTYPNNKTAEIEYEVVNHRGVEDIYMKTTLGYFLWEMLDITDGGLFFAINWWYCPPAREIDLEALKMAEQLLADSSNWHKMDDRKCEDDIANNKWSLFCAIKYASIEKMGEYNHHNTAMQALRFTIDELVPNHGFEHTLMDYNNSPSTTHKDIVAVINKAKKKITDELQLNENDQ